MKGWNKMIDMVETSIGRIQGDKYTTISTGERKFVNQLKEWVIEYPEDVCLTINTDGSAYARVPYDWLRFVKPPTKRNYTEEQRQAMGERMKKARENRKGIKK